jgi:hypothetical protein
VAFTLERLPDETLISREFACASASKRELGLCSAGFANLLSRVSGLGFAILKSPSKSCVARDQYWMSSFDVTNVVKVVWENRGYALHFLAATSS